MEQKKKLTNAQLEKRMKQAIVFVPRTKDTKSIYFSDKGLRLTITNDYAIVETGYHSHVFSHYNTATGESRPYIYLNKFVDIALASDCQTSKGYSYGKLFKNLKKNEDDTDSNIMIFVDWWLYNIFQPLYSISETAAGSWLVYFNYMHNVATNHILLDEHKDGMTNKEFAEAHKALFTSFLENVPEHRILEPMSDDEFIQQEIQSQIQDEQEVSSINDDDESI